MITALNIARVVLIGMFALAWLGVVMHVLYGGFLVLKAYGRMFSPQARTSSREQLQSGHSFLRPLLPAFYRRFGIIFLSAVLIFLLLLAIDAWRKALGGT